MLRKNSQTTTNAEKGYEVSGRKDKLALQTTAYM